MRARDGAGERSPARPRPERRPQGFLILSASPGYGGAERSMEILVRHAPQDARVTVVADSDLHLAALRRLARPGLEIVHLDTGRPGTFGRSVAALVALFLRVKPRAVLANTHHSALLLAAAAPVLRQFGARFWLYVRDFLWLDAEAIFARLPDANVLVPSDVVLERPHYVARHIGQARVVPDMVELGPSDGAAPAATPAAFLHLATVNAWKGHAHLLNALALAREAGVPLKCRSRGPLGDRAVLASIETRRASLRLGDTFELLGYVADPVPDIRAATAVVVTSVSHSGGPETFCRAIIEAWACERPVIAFAAGAPAGIISHEVNGLLVPEGDDQALAAALVRLARDPALARRLGAAGRRVAEHEYEAKMVAARFWATLAGPAAAGAPVSAQDAIAASLW